MEVYKGQKLGVKSDTGGSDERKVNASEVTIVVPKVGDSVVIVGGDQKEKLGKIGDLIGVDGQDGIIKMQEEGAQVRPQCTRCCCCCCCCTTTNTRDQRHVLLILC